MSKHAVTFGTQTGQQNVAWSDLLSLWKNADAWGYDSLWNFDHFYPIFSDPSGPCMECWTTLGALAQATEHVSVGQLVSGNTYRQGCSNHRTSWRSARTRHHRDREDRDAAALL